MKDFFIDNLIDVIFGFYDDVMGIVVDKLRVLYICIIGFKCNLNYIF